MIGEKKRKITTWVLTLMLFSATTVSAFRANLTAVCVDASDYGSRLEKAANYLAGQYNPAVGLCREARNVAPKTYWLVSDNLWACYALKNSHPDISDRIKLKLQHYAVLYDLPRNSEGLPISYKHEAVIGDTVPLPFHSSIHYTLETNEYTIKIEIANSTSVMFDWQDYADLLLYATLSYHCEGNNRSALDCFNKATSMWDGKGIWDIAAQTDKKYATYKLALLLYVSKRLNVTLPFEEELINRIWSQQNKITGAIITDYLLDGTPAGDTNTETTSIVVIALISCADIAVANVEPYRTIIGQNSTTKIYVTVSNLGGRPISSFNVTLYANATTIQTIKTSIISGYSTTLTFEWNVTVPLGNYTLRAVAEAVANETILANNSLVYEIIKVSIPGDINADRKVNIVDVAKGAKTFGSKPGDSGWDANADVNEDGIINIIDIATVAREFGKTV
jgi:hypothetical protein